MELNRVDACPVCGMIAVAIKSPTGLQVYKCPGGHEWQSKKHNKVTKEQPLPTEGRQSVTDELIKLLKERQAKGIATYGRSLETFNGRDARRDALEEALDLTQYLMQMYLEEKAERERTAIELNHYRAFATCVEKIDNNAVSSRAFALNVIDALETLKDATGRG